MSRQSRERQRYQNSQTKNRGRSSSANANAQARYQPTSGGALGGGNVALPGAPGNPTVPALPPDPGLIAAQAQTGRLTGYADAQATYDSGRIDRDFGYNPDGTISSDPYSRAALLERQRQIADRSITNSAGAAGNPYAGSTQDSKNTAAFDYLSSNNSLRNQYSDAKNQTTLNRVGAYSEAGASLPPEMLAALKRALGQG